VKLLEGKRLKSVVLARNQLDHSGITGRSEPQNRYDS
jgi:hypothetical protein